MTSKTLILIDGHALAYRSYFALERTGMKTRDGKHTWAVFGFFKAIFDLLARVQPDAIAVTFDCGRETFRLEAYSEYKANRQSMPDSMREQLQYIHEGVEALDIPIYKLPGFEADDLIGTIVTRAKSLGHKSLILTGDQDSFQLIDKEGQIKVLIPSKGELVEYDRDKVHEKMEIYPEDVVDYKALRGDTSDNIPGVKGIGEKTAVKLLKEFGTLDGVYEHINEITSKSIKSKLETDKEIAYKSQFLATIKLDVPMEFDFEHTHLTMPNIDKLSEFLTTFQLNAFLKQLPTILKPFNNGVVPDIKLTAEPEIKTDSQLSLFSQMPQENNHEKAIIEQEISDCKHTLEIIDSEQKLDDLIKILNLATVISLDTETTDLDTLRADLVGISFGINPQVNFKDGNLFADKTKNDCVNTFYIPVGHIEGKQLDRIFVLDKLKLVFENDNIKKVLQNAKYEINILKNYNITLKGIIFDTMLASYVKDPAGKHGLKQQALLHLNYSMTKIEELIGKGKNALTMDKVSINDSAKYACMDAASTINLADYYLTKLDNKDKEILNDIEMPLISVLADMERTGVCVDKEYLAELSKELGSKLEKIETAIFEIAGERFNVNSPKQVADILFEKLQLPVKAGSKTKTGISTDAKTLEYLKDINPIAGLLLEHRHLSKLKSTYVDSLPLLINPKTKRIHTSYNQTATTTGRLSSSNPNLQNIPIRSEIGNRIRAAFVTEDHENYVILAADYSQIELRLLAHVSQDENLVSAFRNNIDIHTDTASKVFNVSTEEVTKDMRRQAKAVNFGIIYGQTSYGLSESLGIPASEAKQMIEKYFETYPKIKEYIENTIKEAQQNGCVATFYGRKRYFDEDIHSRNKNIREFAQRAAVNAPLQGTAADLIKLAMIKLHDELQKRKLKSKLILQVHDELVLETAKDELDEVINLVKDCMELNQPFSVPLEIDITSAKNWMEV
ncbi:MAG: DNA polymerase I [bacterium]